MSDYNYCVVEVFKLFCVGIAVQGSTDAARAAADIVLTEPGLSTIVHGILTARCIFVSE